MDKIFKDVRSYNKPHWANIWIVTKHILMQKSNDTTETMAVIGIYFGIFARDKHRL